MARITAVSLRMASLWLLQLVFACEALAVYGPSDREFGCLVSKVEILGPFLEYYQGRV